MRVCRVIYICETQTGSHELWRKEMEQDDSERYQGQRDRKEGKG